MAVVKFLGKVVDFLSGGLGEKIVDALTDYFPPSMSEQDKAQFKLVIKQQVHEQSKELLELAHQEREQFARQIHQHEGTASDLQHFGWLGRIIVFLRGCQRPVWGFLTLYIDIKWFSGQWPDMSKQQESALWIINLLVLGFLFGERAIKNLMPLITEMMKQRGIK